MVSASEGAIGGVTTRIAFLSSSPSRVILGSRPIRAFLRCPDESVELTTVVEQPKGIKAVVASSREASIQIDEGAPAILPGVVEVETTAPGDARPKIPIVRYSSPTSGASASASSS